MERVSGFPLLMQQCTALLKKNLLLSLRNKKAAFLQLSSPLFFMLLMFAIDKASTASTAQLSYFRNIKDPQRTPFPPIPPCEDKVAIKMPCYDFVWSGDGNRKFRAIANRIMRNNPGRRIPPSKVKSFKDKAAVDEWLVNNPTQCPGAIHFMEKTKTVFSYGIQSNSTATPTRDGKYEEDPDTTFQLPLQLAAEREIARYLLRDPGFSWNVFLEEYAHPSEKPLTLESLMYSMFYLSIAMLHFILQMTNVVTEKELKLRQSMNTMGLYDTAYWLSWVTWEAAMTVTSALLTVLVGMALHFPMFLKNSFVVVFLAFFLFQLSMTTMGFALTAFIGKSSSATAMGTAVFMVGSILQFVTSFGIYEIVKGKVMKYVVAASLLPPTLFGHALYLLSEASSDPEGTGLSWSDAWKCPVKTPKCRLTMGGVYGGFLGLFFGWFLLAIYFDNIVPNIAGVRKSCYYFLFPGYWQGKGAQQVKDGWPDIFFCFGDKSPPEEHGAPDDEDVIEEENKVKRQVAEGVVDENVACQIRGLVKSYKGTVGFKCKKSASYTAVKGLWVNFQKDQLFCLLGPNGAGKTTTIGCLTGISPVTDGDAFIHGNTIRTSSGMSNIQKMIGVCPQFDILWHTLTGEEHLHLFAKIKGLPPSSIPSITKAALDEVMLAEAATVRAGSYSGGMKRRLSVAGALMGNPKLVILDEPTTGMDPITRRHVWDIIENAKKGRAIILTTHSMEEADILGDRIGIMAKGKLRCIGTSIRLKSRFGSGFIANISFHADAVSASHSKALKQFFKSHLDVVPKEENNNFLTFVIPHDREKLLKNFFAELQDREEEFGVSDIQLGLTTLEEVFLNIAKQAELEGAAAEGKLTTLTLTSGESAQIPVGARFVGIPETESEENPTGFMVEVYWEVDDNGKLVIAGHSRKVPITPSIQLSSPSERLRKKLQRSRSVHGIVIDPSQVSSDDFK